MISSSIIFSTIAFYYECCKSWRKERESVVGGNSKSGRTPSFPDTCQVWLIQLLVLWTYSQISNVFLVKTCYSSKHVI